jgi:multiple sugar transport system permease protein
VVERRIEAYHADIVLQRGRLGVMANQTQDIGVDASVASRRLSPRKKLKNAQLYHPVVPYMFMLPFVSLFAFFFFVPFIYNLWNSFSAQRAQGIFEPMKVVWVGLDNYTKLLNDDAFKSAIARVLQFGLIQIPIMMGLALVLAMMMDSAVIRWRPFFRLAAFMPYAVPGVVATIIWQFLYSPASSPIVQFTSFIGVHPNPDFLGPGAIIGSIANIATWEFAGFNMIIFYSALQAIPQEYYESARIDGLSELRIALRIKLPLIAPAFVLGMIFSLVGTLQLFNEPLLLRTIARGVTSTFTPNMMAYNSAFVNTDLYYGGAIATVMALITFIFSFGFLAITRRQSGV